MKRKTILNLIVLIPVLLLLINSLYKEATYGKLLDLPPDILISEHGDQNYFLASTTEEVENEIVARYNMLSGGVCL